MTRVMAREAQRIGLENQAERELLPSKARLNKIARAVRAANARRTLEAAI